MHSLPVIIDFICQKYQVTPEQLRYSYRGYDLTKLRQIAILLADVGVECKQHNGRDSEMAKLIGRDRTTVVCHRKTLLGNMQFDRSLKSEFEQLKRQLLQFEIS